MTKNGVRIGDNVDRSLTKDELKRHIAHFGPYPIPVQIGPQDEVDLNITEGQMKVHPKQYLAAITHIAKHWRNGCSCPICKTVDKQENITK